MLTVEIHATSHIGRVRKGNEDNYLLLHIADSKAWTSSQEPHDFIVESQNFEVGDIGLVLAVSDGMGGALAGEIVERVSKQRLRDFHKREIFDVLGMKDSSLGMGGRRIGDTVLCQTGTGPDVDRFGANSQYWRDMGHPWGGMHSTVTDLAVLLQTFLNGGQFNGKRLLSPATVARMTSDQNSSIKKPWGLGWGLATSPVWVYCGDLVSLQTFGHSGATGTVAWADPVTQTVTVILTTRASAEDDGRLLRTVSNAVAAAVVK